MSQLLSIHPAEAVHVDQERLGSLYAQLGENGAEDVVCRAMEELASRLTQCERLYREGRITDLRHQARSLIAIAEQIGMQGVSGVADSVTQCVDASDHVALAATLSRLLRVGERSLSAMWDHQEFSI